MLNLEVTNFFEKLSSPTYPIPELLLRWVVRLLIFSVSVSIFENLGGDALG
jgi:hypothetical protein